MAFTYGFYNYNENDADQKLYDAEQMSQLFDGIITDGVYAHVGSCFLVGATGSGANSVTIGSGRAWFNHTWSYNDKNYILEAPLPPSTQDRIDAVVIDINSNKNSRMNKFDWKIGTESSNPKRPTLTHEEKHNQYALAYVRRSPGVTVISAGDISNAVGTDETPYVTGVLETISASQILSDFTAQFNSFITSSTDRVTNLLTEWRYGYRDFIDGCNSEFESALHGYEIQVDDLISQKTTEFNSFLSQKTSDFTSFLNSKTTEFNSFISTKNNDFAGFVNTKTAEFSSFLEDCESEFDSFLTNLSSRCDAEIKKYALVAEGWAAGTQDGTPTSIMPYFHNNAKYHSEQASASASAANTAKNDAITAKNDSVSAKDTAVAAKERAVTAETTATNAKNDAVEAKDETIAAKNTTITAKEATMVAAQAAVTAKDDVLNAKEAVLDAKDIAISYAARAINASDTAQDARDEAIESKQAAEQSAELAESARSEVFGALGVPVFTIDFSTGRLMYSDDSKYTFTINNETGQLTYAHV